MENTKVNKNDLKTIYESFNKTLKESGLDAAMKFRNEEANKSIAEYTKTAEEKSQTEEMLKGMCPISCEAAHVDFDGKKANVYITGVFNNPEKSGETVKQEMMVDFSEEGETWKMGTVMYMGGSDNLKKSADDKWDGEASYDMASNTSTGGRILWAKFEPEYTVVAIQMLDEEDLIYLPKKEDLSKVGLKAEEIEAWRMISVDGHSHKTNPMKILAVKAEVKDMPVGQQ